MNGTDEVDLADRLARKRARGSAALAIVFLATQGGSLSSGRADGHFDWPFVLWAAVLIVILLFGGGWFHGAGVRRAMNDESTQAHRRAAMAGGFVIGLLGAVLLYVLSFYDEVTAREALRLVITMSVAGALLRFAMLEKRALGR
jgi:hypothetical protein